MQSQSTLQVIDDFDFLLSFLPKGWEAKAKELGALRRCRKIPDARVLLRLLLIHLAEGCSFRETSVRAKQGGVLDISDVAIMDRLRGSGAWFQWMNQEMMKNWVRYPSTEVYGNQLNVRVIDGTHVHEPGPTGSTWRIHYAIDLSSLRCSEFYVTDSRGVGTGETFKRFEIHPGDLFIGDRGYGISGGISHVVDGGGDVLVRFSWSNLPLWETNGERFDLFDHLRTLEGTRLGDWPVLVKDGDRFVSGRVCALRRSRQSAEKAIKHARRRSQKHGAAISGETLEAACYVFVFTTVDAQAFRPTRILEFYRGRWQIELVFKRLKSIMELSHLRKHDEEASKAWLQGKLFVALLLEALLHYGESFFPWGYPLWTAERS